MQSSASLPPPPPPQEGRWGEALAALPLVSCGAEATLRSALTQLLNHNKHRVYVVDGEGRPLGVVTPTDVLRLVISG